MPSKDELQHQIQELEQRIQDLEGSDGQNGNDTSAATAGNRNANLSKHSRRRFLKTLAGGAAGLGMMGMASGFQIRSPDGFSFFGNGDKDLDVDTQGNITASSIDLGQGAVGNLAGNNLSVDNGTLNAATGGGDTFRVINVMDYDVKGNGSYDDTAGIQAAINDADRDELVWFPWPDEHYTISDTIHFGEAGQASHLQGAGRVPITVASGATINGAMLRCASGEADGATGVTVANFDLDADQNNNGTAEYCLHLGYRSNYISDCEVFNVRASYADSHGIYLDQPITTELVNCRSRYHGGDGFHVHGTATSTLFTNCYANNMNGHGFYVRNAFYVGFNTTASDYAGKKAYYLDGSNSGEAVASVTFTNPGAEYATEESFHFEGCYGVTLNSPQTTEPSDDFPVLRIGGFTRNVSVVGAYLYNDPANAPTVYVTDDDWTYNNVLLGCEIASLGGPGGDTNLSLFNTSVDTSAPPSNTETRIQQDLEVLDDGDGVIVSTPDGTARYRIRVDNSGNVTTDQL